MDNLKDSDIVSFTEMNKIVEVQYMQNRNKKANIKKIDKNRYMILKTGEVKEFKESESRKDNLNSLRQSIKKLRYLINNNFSGKENELFITLTYAENMTDSEKLYKDFDKFIKRLRYDFKNKSRVGYIGVVEPQERGAWHMHILMKFYDFENVFIENQKLAEIWGNGFVNIRKLKNVDNIGAYLSAYLTNLKDGENTKKGARLYLYPANINLFRKSRDMKYPERVEMFVKSAKKKLGNAVPNFSKTYIIDKPDENYSNKIIYYEYKLK